MSDPVFKPRLPNYGNQDGDQIVDAHGNVYEFNAETNQWIYRGVIPAPEVVTEIDDGLVSPEIYRKLVLIQELMDQGYDFSSFKLDSGIDNPYYYYFNSSDDLVKFIPEKLVTPKELKFQDMVRDVLGGTESTTIELTQNRNLATNELAGCQVETQFGTYKIISNGTGTLILEGGMLNLLQSDEIKVFQPTIVKNQLRVEVDRGRLFQKLMRNCCVGPKGQPGPQGIAGRDGIPADNEVFLVPESTEGNVFVVEAQVATPIETPISLRIFREEVQVIEFLYAIGGTEDIQVILSDPNLSVDQTTFEFFYDPDTEQFTGSFQVNGADISDWQYKVRQQGPKGKTGEDGRAFFVIEDNMLDDPIVQSSNALSSLRKSSNGDLLVYNRELFDEIPASNLGALEGDSITDLTETKFVGLEPTIRNAKGVGFFSFVEGNFNAPPLDLPSWTPTGDCVQARRWAQYRFEWFNRVDPKYLYSILSTPKPAEQCCQDDFFFCPNVGDEPCGIVGGVNTPRVDVPCDCDCESPIVSELGGENGFTWELIDLTQSTQEAVTLVDESIPEISEEAGQQLSLSQIAVSGMNSAQGVIDGTVNEFFQAIRMCGVGEISVTLQFDPNVCGGEVEERTGCAFIDSDAVSVSISLVDNNQVSEISSGGLIESPTMPVTGTFFVSTLTRTVTSSDPVIEPGDTLISVDSEGELPAGIEVDNFQSESTESAEADLELRVVVNSLGLNLCRGYRVTVRAFADRFNCKTPKTTITTKTFIIPDPGRMGSTGSTGTNVIPGSSGSSGGGQPGSSGSEPGMIIPIPSFAPMISIIASPGTPVPPFPPPIPGSSVGSEPPPPPGGGTEPPVIPSPVSMITDLTTIPDDNTESVVADYAITFTTDGAIAVDDVLIFTFPAGFDITSATFSSGSIDGTFTVNDSGQDLVVTRNGDGSSTAAGFISATIGTVTNSTPASYSISLEIQDSGLSNLAGPTAGASFSIVAAGTPALEFIWYNGDEDVTAFGGVFDGWGFAPTSPIPNTYQVWLEYPADQNITLVNPGLGDVQRYNMPGAETVTVVGQTIRIARTSGADWTGPLYVRVNNVFPPPDDSDRVYTVQVRDNAGTTIIEESSFTMTHYTGTASRSGYTGNQIFGVAGGVGGAPPYDSSVYTIAAGNLSRNNVSAPGCFLGVGNAFYEAVNGTHVSVFGNIPILDYPDPDPSGCHYGKEFDLGSPTIYSGFSAKEMTRFEGLTRPWVPSALTVNSITTDDQSGLGAATTITWNFTLNTHLWADSRFIFTFPMDFTTANLELSSETIPVDLTFGPAAGWIVTRTGFGVFEVYRRLYSNVIEAGTYDITFTKTFGSITNPASGSQMFSLETRTAASPADAQIDSTGSTSIVYT